MQEQQPQRDSKISNTEWGLVIGFCAMVDVSQYALDAVFGEPINIGLDILMTMSLQLYFYLRGVKASSKKLIAWIGTPFLGFITMGVASFWTADVIVTMLLDKAEKKLPKLPI